MTTMTDTSSRNIALAGARIAAGLLGGAQVSGAVYFVFMAPGEAVWRGPWLDVPIVAVMVTGFLLKLGVAFLPGLHATRRIMMGFLAVAIGAAVTLVKIPVYDEPEGVLFLVFDAVLLALLTVAWRTTER